MLRTPWTRAQFLRWLFRYCNENPDVHVEAWWALNQVLDSDRETCSMILSALLAARCSHDLYAWGFCQGYHGTGMPQLMRNAQGRRTISILQGDFQCVVTDGPVPAGPFRFRIRARRRRQGDYYIELQVGFVPWPYPDDVLHFGRLPGSYLFVEMDAEDEFRWDYNPRYDADPIADFSFRRCGDGYVRLWNETFQREVQCPRPRSRLEESHTGAYAVLMLHNSNSLELTYLG